MTYEPYDFDAEGYVDATGEDQELLADLEALVLLGLVAPVVRGDGELGIAPVEPRPPERRQPRDRHAT